MTGEANKSFDIRQIIDALYATFFKEASAIVATGKQHLPLMLEVPIPSQSNEIELAVTALTSMDKDAMANMIKVASQHPGNLFVIYIAEAWAISVDKNSSEHKEVISGMKKVADVPERMEVIIFNFVGADFTALAYCKIDRKTKSLKKSPLQFSSDEGVEIKGRFSAHLRKTQQKIH